MSYNPEYYGASEVQTTARELYAGEVNAVERLQNEATAKSELVTADESKYPAQVVSAPRELYEREVNAVENLKNHEQLKAEVITQDDDEVKVHQLERELNAVRKELDELKG